jgi:hypothetical protein
VYVGSRRPRSATLAESSAALAAYATARSARSSAAIITRAQIPAVTLIWIHAGTTVLIREAAQR